MAVKQDPDRHVSSIARANQDFELISESQSAVKS
ncbi:hypothetical protein CCACVL1_12474 [Corchorus capsularis]|uniref:Uncharacterized protein n=1 Tax=Corchorus capsularis TaxID=210143 RepID=A0A1R3IFK7_COCAP|nr:hypothetical protein CCACVL1_12474 [Corchorus capsularis]